MSEHRDFSTTSRETTLSEEMNRAFKLTERELVTDTMNDSANDTSSGTASTTAANKRKRRNLSESELSRVPSYINNSNDDDNHNDDDDDNDNDNNNSTT